MIRSGIVGELIFIKIDVSPDRKTILGSIISGVGKED